MEVTEVEVHRRPQHVDDDGDEESPPIGIGSGQTSHNRESRVVNPLAPNAASANPPTRNDDDIGAGHANPVSVEDEETTEPPPRSSPATRQRCEIEIEPDCVVVRGEAAVEK
ncbi:hypothetical protein NECAME_03181 [Necator americanus]|uniref:Uncharacterized protein n=1 Tax=Necator americanus TaxID=51031 RepID=W2T955_NECAM|nr:hypothetical protein NECAME_03181 [Necator americanus]ETN77517.1 hypothetical protein NECAME_03181 [Necator americanus]